MVLGSPTLRIVLIKLIEKFTDKICLKFHHLLNGTLGEKLVGGVHVTRTTSENKIEKYNKDTGKWVEIDETEREHILRENDKKRRSDSKYLGQSLFQLLGSASSSWKTIMEGSELFLSQSIDSLLTGLMKIPYFGTFIGKFLGIDVIKSAVIAAISQGGQESWDRFVRNNRSAESIIRLYKSISRVQGVCCSPMYMHDGAMLGNSVLKAENTLNVAWQHINTNAPYYALMQLVKHKRSAQSMRVVIKEIMEKELVGHSQTRDTVKKVRKENRTIFDGLKQYVYGTTFYINTLQQEWIPGKDDTVQKMDPFMYREFVVHGLDRRLNPKKHRSFKTGFGQSTGWTMASKEVKGLSVSVWDKPKIIKMSISAFHLATGVSVSVCILIYLTNPLAWSALTIIPGVTKNATWLIKQWVKQQKVNIPTISMTETDKSALLDIGIEVVGELTNVKKWKSILSSFSDVPCTIEAVLSIQPQREIMWRKDVLYFVKKFRHYGEYTEPPNEELLIELNLRLASLGKINMFIQTDEAKYLDIKFINEFIKKREWK
jgi:hypothetical protein